MRCTPIEYVTNYRLNKACELMADGKNVTEAALLSGFNSSSYFSETFKKKYKISAREYKKRLLE